MRWKAMALCALLVLGALGCRGPARMDAASQRSAQSLLAPFQTRAQLESYLGGAPQRCVSGGGVRELCSWRLSGRDPAWSGLARTVLTRDRVAVLCELPRDGSARDWDSCTVHPKRSSRNHWRSYGGVGASLPQRRREAAQRERLKPQAQQLLDGAKTLVAMSRLMGQLPDRCQPIEPYGQVCDWLATKHTYGHGIVAAASDVSLSKKVKLTCTYPGGSCTAVMP